MTIFLILPLFLRRLQHHTLLRLVRFLDASCRFFTVFRVQLDADIFPSQPLCDCTRRPALEERIEYRITRIAPSTASVFRSMP